MLFVLINNNLNEVEYCFFCTVAFSVFSLHFSYSFLNDIFPFKMVCKFSFLLIQTEPIKTIIATSLYVEALVLRNLSLTFVPGDACKLQLSRWQGRE